MTTSHKAQILVERPGLVLCLWTCASESEQLYGPSSTPAYTELILSGMGPGKVHFGENLPKILCGLGHLVVEAKEARRGWRVLAEI